MRDISWFCDTDPDCRYALTTPWVKGGYEYATNGRIAVRQPAPGQPDVDDGKKRPKNMDKNPYLFGKPASCTEPWPDPHGLYVKPISDDYPLRDPVWGIVAADTVIAGRLIAGCYVLLISLLGKVQYDPSGGKEDPLRFAAEGIEGTVMPMKVLKAPSCQ